MMRRRSCRMRPNRYDVGLGWAGRLVRLFLSPCCVVHLLQQPAKIEGTFTNLGDGGTTTTTKTTLGPKLPTITVDQVGLGLT